MPKWLWVALPLLLAAAALGLAILRGRRPSRAALNAWSSLLLAGYLLATAALGIFWVANQQLPVFDWHYLFGYGTVLLVALHLAINLPQVVRYFSRSTRPAAVAPPIGRRFVLGSLGAAAAAGAAFLLGLRQGSYRISIGPLAGHPPAGGLDVVERFHALSAHSRGGVLLRAPGAEWEAEAPAFKRYPGAVRIGLRPPRGTSRSAPALARLGAVLWHTCGVTEQRGGLQLRASPSSGALFSTELYVMTAGYESLQAGTWHYDAEHHVLERAGSGFQGTGAGTIIAATAVFRRTGRKYRERTYRYVLADLGHALENLRAAADVLGLSPTLATAFDEAGIAATLGVDEREEGVLALVALGGAPAGAALAGASPLPPAAWPQGSVQTVTHAIHLATSLRLAAPAPVLSASQAGGPARRMALPRAASAAADPLAMIARRRSVRRFAAGRALPLDAVSAILLRMSDEALPRYSHAVRICIVVNRVDDLAPGAYRYDAAAHSLVPIRAPADLQGAAQAAALDQEVIGDAAAVFVLGVDRAALAADALGAARGYRHAFLQAGLAGERIYLEATARGLAACAVGAFYDDEAQSLVGADPAREWVVHFAALGVPASSP